MPVGAIPLSMGAARGIHTRGLVFNTMSIPPKDGLYTSGVGRALGTTLLEADLRAAQRARAFLGGRLADVLDDEGLTVAGLLVTELVTNAVVHAASPVEVSVSREGSLVTVSVRDADTGPLRWEDRPAGDLAEGGRGLLIVDQLAHSWGTVHSGGRKSVWFRVPFAASVPADDGAGRAGPAPTVPAARAVPGPPGAVHVAERRLRSLLLPGRAQRALGFDQHVGHVLTRIVDGVGAVGGQVRSATDGLVAACGDTGPADPYRYELALADRPLGCLLLHFDRAHGTPGEGQAWPEAEAEARAFARLGADRLALLAYEHGALQGDQARSEQLEFLSEATEMLASTLDVRDCLALLTQLAVPRLGQWAAAYRVDERGRPRLVTVNHVREDDVARVRPVLDGEPVTGAVRGAVGSATSKDLGPVAGRSDAIVVVPLVLHGRVKAVLVVGAERPPAPMVRLTLTELVRRSAVAVENALLHEERSDAATALQATLLPAALPRVPGLDLAAAYHSAAPGLSVGGDFYDAFVIGDGTVVCAVGDVCGKGASAAAVTGLSRNLIRTLMRDGGSLPGTVRRLNRALNDELGGARFCTLALVRLEQSEDGARAQVCLAGHPQPVVVRAAGGSEVVGVPGDLLGVMAQVEVTGATVHLGPGDCLVLYTDGVTERREDGRMFGLAGVRDVLDRVAGQDAGTCVRQVEQAARSFGEADLRDDLAILAVGVRPPPTGG
jgi:phosphoserine phosphatase RsbU/P